MLVRSRLTVGAGRFATAALLCAAAWLPPANAAEGLFYREVDGRIVITNVQDKANLKPLPGFESRPPIRAYNALPVTRYDRLIDQVAREVGLSSDLLKAVVQVESGFDERARSPKGAMGLMQLMPETARELGVRFPYDPLENLRGGARYLKQLLERYGGDLRLSLAAYNAGATTVQRYGGVPAFRETRDYVRRIEGLLGDRPARARAAKREASAPVRTIRTADGTLAFVN